MKATNNNLIIKLIFDEKETRSIILSEDSKKQCNQVYGLVIDVGPDFPYDVKKGDKILFPRNEGIRINEGDEEYYCLNERWVEAIIYED